MAIDTIADRLRALEVFRGLSVEQLERIARSADRMIFRDGQALAKAGTEGDGALVVVAGQASIVADEERAIAAAPVVTGSLIGELAMVTEHQFTITVVADGDVRAIKIVRDVLRAHMADDPELLEHFQTRLTSRLSRVAIELKLIDERLTAATVEPDLAQDTA